MALGHEAFATFAMESILEISTFTFHSGLPKANLCGDLQGLLLPSSFYIMSRAHMQMIAYACFLSFTLVII